MKGLICKPRIMCNTQILMKIGIAQINTTVGDFEGNRIRILEAYDILLKQGAELIIFPELVICGYPPRDLLLKPQFCIDAVKSLHKIACKIDTVPAIIGTVEYISEINQNRILFNSAAWCENRTIKQYFRKSLLPNYDVFDEARYFKAEDTPNTIEWNNKIIGVTICEDIWTYQNEQSQQKYKTNPIEQLSKIKLDLLINLSASPWHVDKEISRQNLIKNISQRLNCPVAYCNAIGGNDELIFDGESMIIDPKTKVIAQMPKFEEGIQAFNLNSPTKVEDFNKNSDIKNIHKALVLGLKDYIFKSGFNKVLIGLSGGIDSAVVAALAKEAVGFKNILGVAMPSKISSVHSIKDAEDLAQNLNIPFKILPITKPVKAIEENLANLFSGMERDIAEENIQARLRGLQLMALSNKLNHLVLTTGNKSEIAVGYCTLYGDMCGGLAVISDLPKMQVYALAKYINRNKELIPKNTINKPPSAELSPNQKDEDSLPPYPILDSILYNYIEAGLTRSEIISRGFNAQTVDWVLRKVDQNEYKRKQAAPGLKISPLAFGIGRRMPIVQKYLN